MARWKCICKYGTVKIYKNIWHRENGYQDIVLYTYTFSRCHIYLTIFTAPYSLLAWQTKVARGFESPRRARLTPSPTLMILHLSKIIKADSNLVFLIVDFPKNKQTSQHSPGAQPIQWLCWGMETSGRILGGFPNKPNAPPVVQDKFLSSLWFCSAIFVHLKIWMLVCICIWGS